MARQPGQSRNSARPGAREGRGAAKSLFLGILLAFSAVAAVCLVGFWTLESARQADVSASSTVGRTTGEDRPQRRSPSRSQDSDGHPQGFMGGLITWALDALGVSDSASRTPGSKRADGIPGIGRRELADARRSGTLDPGDAAAPSISGKVVDETGEPVAGMELTARVLGLFEPNGEEPHRQVFHAVTDSAGLYRFQWLAPGEYRVRSTATERYAAAEIRVRTGTPASNLTVRGQLTLTVRGSVTNSRGEAVEGVEVTARGKSPEIAYSDEDGLYQIRLPVDEQRQSYRLGFSRQGYRKSDLNIYRRDVAGRHGIRRDVQLQRIRRLVEVSGRLTDGEGAPVRAENIYLVGPGRYQAVTTGSGDFHISDVEAEATYSLWVRPRGPFKDYSERVRIGASGLRIHLALEPLEYGSLSGRMKDAHGDPVPHFSLWARSGGAVGQQAVLVMSDASGRYLAERVPAGAVMFSTLSNPRLSVGPFQLPAGGVEELELVLDLGGHEIAGRVMDQAGRPVAAPQVTLDGRSRSGQVPTSSVREVVGDVDGFFRFTGIGGGWYLVRAYAVGYQVAQVECKADEGGELLVQLSPVLTKSRLGN